jgi:AcrR family transcriptional regulator
VNTGPQPGLRERSREILRAELAEAAAEFCAEHGFAEVTAEEIAQGIGVSRATFFRYFTSKEDAVVSALRGRPRALAEQVAAVVPATGDTAWTLLRRAVGVMEEAAATRGDRLRARIRMIDAVPALKGRLAWERRTEQAAVAEVLAERVADPRDAAAIAAAGISAIDLAWQEWAATPGSDLGALLDAQFAALARVGTVPIAPGASG